MGFKKDLLEIHAEIFTDEMSSICFKILGEEWGVGMGLHETGLQVEAG